MAEKKKDVTESTEIVVVEVILSIMVGIFSSNKAEPMLHPDLYSGMHNTAYA